MSKLPSLQKELLQISIENIKEMLDKPNAPRTSIWASGWIAGVQEVLTQIGYSQEEIRQFFQKEEIKDE